MRTDLMNIEDYEDTFEDHAPENRLIQACDDGAHIWTDTYYGVACRKCGIFYAAGCEPWLDVDDDDDDDPKGHNLECTCETCIQNYPERLYLLDLLDDHYDDEAEWDERND